MNYERLETAKKFLLEVLQPLWEERGIQKFNMGFWIKPEDSAGKKEVIKRGHITVECGSAGCFVGWLPTIFPGEFEIRESVDRVVYISWGSIFNSSAAKYFFEIDHLQVEEIILAGCYSMNGDKIEPKHVAEKIDKLLQEEEQ